MPYNQLLVQLEIRCKNCGIKIIRDHSNRKFCEECRKTNKRIKEQLYNKLRRKHRTVSSICEVCLSVFEGKRKKKLCSKECKLKQQQIQRHLKKIEFHKQKINLLRGNHGS